MAIERGLAAGLQHRAAGLWRVPRTGWQRLVSRLRARLGGPARLRVIVLLACVLGLDTADLSSLGAVASKLKPALRLDNTQLGLLAAAPSLVAVLATLPMGVLADRFPRVRTLAVAVAIWAAGMIMAGACGSFEELLVVRLFLGGVTAAAAPFVASLVGDLFPPAERGRIYGYILAGELLGAGFGLIASGNVAAASWRAALWVLALPSLAVAVGLWRLLPEPARGGASRLTRGARAMRTRPQAKHERQAARAAEPAEGGRRSAAVERAVERSGTSPRRELVLTRDPVRMSAWSAARYVLRVRTNVWLIIASSLGYFFQAGVNTFGVVFVIAVFRVSQTAATWLLALIAGGALAGTVLGGRVADALLARGRASARMLVAGLAFIVCSLLFALGLLTRDLAIALPIYIAAAALLGAPNAPVDAARLDIIPSRLWGRAEAVRTVLRSLAVATAPLMFGVLSDALASGARSTTKGFGYHASGPGLRYSFLLMLAPMAAGGAILLRSAGAYTRDVATAIASDEAIERDREAHRARAAAG